MSQTPNLQVVFTRLEFTSPRPPTSLEQALQFSLSPRDESLSLNVKLSFTESDMLPFIRNCRLFFDADILLS